MRIHKGKAVFSRKDTYGLNYTLQSIILAGLIKFRDTLKEQDEKGKVYAVPIFDGNFDSEPQSEKWFEILDQMIFSFDLKNEPDIADYDVGFNFDGDSVNISNQQEFDKYKQGLEEYNKKKQQGFDLFAKHFEDLCW